MSTCRSFASVLASVSSRCARRSASASGPRARSSAWRAAEWAASARSARRIGAPRGLGLDLRQLALHRRHLVAEAGEPIAVLAHRILQRMAPGGEVGERAGERAERRFRCGQHLVGLGDALVDAGALLVVCRRLAAERLLLGGEPAERGLRVGRQALFAYDIVAELDQPAVELGHAVLGAGLFAFERLARDHQPLQGGRSLGLGLAQRRQLGCHQRLPLRCLGLRAGALGHQPNGQILGALCLGELGIGRDPAQVEQGGFGLAHLLGDRAVADRLPRLPLERVDLGGELSDHVLEPVEILLGCAQPKLRFVPPRMHARNARRLFEHAPALLGLGLDDLADAALMHHGGGA